MIVCGLRGAGKTTLARALDIYDEETRGKTEAPQWKLGRELLALDLTVSVAWGTWGRSERDACGSELGRLPLPFGCAIFRRLWMFSSRGFNAEG